MNARQEQDANLAAAVGILGVVAVLVSAPACLAALALGRLLRPHRGWLVCAAIAGAGAFALAYGAIAAEMRLALEAIGRTKGILLDPGAVAAAVWPHMRTWWLEGLGIAPVLALLFDAIRPKAVSEQLELRERRQQRRQERRERRARKAVGAPPATGLFATGFELGRHLGGDRLLPVKRRCTTMPLERMRKTTLVVGAPGSGKTQTLLRIAYGAVSIAEWSVFVLDAKGDPKTMDRFADIAREAGRTPFLFPNERYDGWRGTGRQISNRLVELIDWAEEGGGTYYRDLSVNLIRLACTAPEGPPRSSGELLRRLDRNTLAGLWAGSSRVGGLLAFKEEDVAACRLRYQSFFDAVDGQLNGEFAFEDADCGYLLLNELSYGEETTKLARFLLEDFKHYVAARKQERGHVLLIVDEFSAIATGERVARLVEIVRSYGASLVLAPQAYEGMGGPEAAARILNAAHTILLHSVPEPEPLVRAAGTRLGIEVSVQHDQGRSLELGSAREQHQHKVSPNEVRSLQPGMCFAIGSGKAQKIQIAPVPPVWPGKVATGGRSDTETSMDLPLEADPRDSQDGFDDGPLRL